MHHFLPGPLEHGHLEEIGDEPHEDHHDKDQGEPGNPLNASG